MRLYFRLITRLVAASTLAISAAAWSEPLKVAVAANFYHVLQDVTAAYEQQYGQKVMLSSGSSGVLFAQITKGAPFDVFLSADAERPRALYDQGLASKPQTYAIGRLVYWQPGQPQATVDDAATVKGKLAIANPLLAPYGKAAEQVLVELGLYSSVRANLVFGGNVNQAYHYVASGNATAGLVAYSQMLQAGHKDFQLITAQRHQPIKQQMVLVKHRGDNSNAAHFAGFILGDQARGMILDAGYDVPGQRTEGAGQ